MIFLNNYCGTYGRAVLWSSTCCRDSFKTCSYIPSLTSRSARDTSRTGTYDYIKSKLCKGNLLMSRPMVWNQVRYREKYPRFHRDMEYPNFDAYRKDQFIDPAKTKWGQGDEKGGISYFVGFLGLLGTMYATKAHLTHYILFMAASADVRAMASIEVDISKVIPGECMSLKWRGKPLFIKHRTPVDIDNESQTPMSALKDPETEEQRTIKPEWLIVIGICTHLGCVPIPNSGDWPGGFYCPCHGSHYDNIGRARKGPAPTNLEVPPYKFLTDTTVLVG